LERGSKFALKQVLDNHFTCNCLLELSGGRLFDNFVQIFVLQSSSHFFLFYVVLEFVFLPKSQREVLSVVQEYVLADGHILHELPE